MSEFVLSEKREGLRDWFWRNSEMIRDDEKGDTWKIKKQKFNKFMNLIKAQDKEFIKKLKESIVNNNFNLSWKYIEEIDKFAGDLNDN